MERLYIVSMKRTGILLMFAGGGFLLGQPALAAPTSWTPQSLRIERIVNKTGFVEIKGVRVKAGATGLPGETVKTINTRAEVFFPNTTQGVMMPETELLLGKRCIQLVKSSAAERPRVMLVGKSSVCLGNQNLAKGKSTMIVEQDEAGIFTVAVLAGQAEIGESDALVDSDYDILKQFPSITPTLGVGLSGYTNAYPASGGLILGSLNGFVPLSQDRSRSILYSYTTTGSNFDGYWGATTELGYRWFSPSNRSTSSVYVGYSGFDSLNCFSNLINVGAGWDKGRWRFGASTGFNTGGCDSAFSFGAINISAPIAKMDQFRSAYLSLTPYILWGDTIPSPSNYYDSSGVGYSPGGRLTLSVPVTESVSLTAFGAADVVNGASVGGTVKVRFPTGGDIIRDPNLVVPAGTANTPDTTAQGGEAAGIAQAGTSGDIIINESYKANFTADGQQIGEVKKISPDEMISFISDYLVGIAPLAESNRVARVAAKNNALTTKVAGILGSQFLDVASLPASETAQQPFDISFFPSAPYGCVATDAGKAYAVQELRNDGKAEAARRVEAADKVYLGPGEKISNGWPVTTFASKAYRFGNGGTCSKINSIINDSESYKGPANPVQTENLN
jgi:hypothetical protein